MLFNNLSPFVVGMKQLVAYQWHNQSVRESGGLTVPYLSDF